MRRWNYVFGILLTGFTLWLTLNMHSRSGIFNYKSTLFADKVGYYCYLPALVCYGFDGKKVPDGLPERVGCGFYVNAAGKIYTKYPIGVAVMEALFFFATHFVVVPLLGEDPDGFSPAYSKAVEIAAWIYMLLALLIMGKVLGEYFKPRQVWAILICFLLGTNLFYYYALESGMSHIYSFFLASAFLRLTQILHRKEKINASLWLTIGLVAAMLVMTRFTNVLLLSMILFWEIGSFQALKARVKTAVTSRGFLLVLIAPILLIGLQMSYYYYLTGSPLHYAYEGEGFDFLRPNMLKVWLSPNNGLFLYSPIVIVGLAGFVWMVRHRIAGGWYAITLFLAVSYIFSCWWEWYFGCAYGARSFVEYYPILMVATGYSLNWIERQKMAWQITAWSLIWLAVGVNFKIGYLYKRCFLGNGDWDWSEYWNLVSGS